MKPPKYGFVLLFKLQQLNWIHAITKHLNINQLMFFWPRTSASLFGCFLFFHGYRKLKEHVVNSQSYIPSIGDNGVKNIAHICGFTLAQNNSAR